MMLQSSVALIDVVVVGETIFSGAAGRSGEEGAAVIRGGPQLGFLARRHAVHELSKGRLVDEHVHRHRTHPRVGPRYSTLTRSIVRQLVPHVLFIRDGGLAGGALPHLAVVLQPACGQGGAKVRVGRDAVANILVPPQHLKKVAGAFRPNEHVATVTATHYKVIVWTEEGHPFHCLPVAVPLVMLLRLAGRWVQQEHVVLTVVHQQLPLARVGQAGDMRAQLNRLFVPKHLQRVWVVVVVPRVTFVRSSPFATTSSSSAVAAVCETGGSQVVDSDFFVTTSHSETVAGGIRRVVSHRIDLNSSLPVVEKLHGQLSILRVSHVEEQDFSVLAATQKGAGIYRAEGKFVGSSRVEAQHDA
mmetsp:Transcript_3306/g.7318  ORF Transcript_3306/g.7318 Transcript_3306/m.7318 type:complete len:358 (-) Transcript_3306:195-1268(-)